MEPGLVLRGARLRETAGDARQLTPGAAGVPSCLHSASSVLEVADVNVTGPSVASMALWRLN